MKGQFNFDHPDAFDTQLLVETLTKLKAGKRVEIPIYNFKVQHCALFDAQVCDYAPRCLVLLKKCVTDHII